MPKKIIQKTKTGIENFDTELQSAVQREQCNITFDAWVRDCFKTNISYDTLIKKVETARWKTGKASREFSDLEKQQGKQALQKVRSRINDSDLDEIVKCAKAHANEALKGSGRKVNRDSLGLKSAQKREQADSLVNVLRMCALGILLWQRLKTGLDTTHAQHVAAQVHCPILKATMSYGQMLDALADHDVVQTKVRKVKGKKVISKVNHRSLNKLTAEGLADTSLKTAARLVYGPAILRRITEQGKSFQPCISLETLTKSDLETKRKADEKVATEKEKAKKSVNKHLPEKGKLTKLTNLADLLCKKFKIQINTTKRVDTTLNAIVGNEKCRKELATRGSKVIKDWTA